MHLSKDCTWGNVSNFEKIWTHISPLLPEVSKISGTFWLYNFWCKFSWKGQNLTFIWRKKETGYKKAYMCISKTAKEILEARDTEKWILANYVFSRKTSDMTEINLAMEFIFLLPFLGFWYLDQLNNQNHHQIYFLCPCTVQDLFMY